MNNFIPLLGYFLFVVMVLIFYFYHHFASRDIRALEKRMHNEFVIYKHLIRINSGLRRDPTDGDHS